MTIQEIISKNRTAIMGFAMISIMLFHQPFFFRNPFVDFFHLFGYWGVEVFLFVSGFGVVYSLKKNSIPIYYKNRLKRLLPSCLLAGFGKFIFVKMGFVNHIPVNTLLLLTSIYLWYIYALVIYYILAPLLYKILNKSAVAFFISVCVFSFVCNYIPFGDSDHYFIKYIGWITSRLPVFVLGMVYALYPIKFSIKHTMIIGVVLLFISMILRLGITIPKFHWHFPHTNLFILFATPMLCVFFSYMHTFASKLKLTQVSLFFGNFSLELYLWHEYLFWNIYKDERFSSLNLYVKCALAVSISIFLAYLTHLLAKYIQDKDCKWFLRK